MTPKARVLSAAFIVTGLGIAQASAAADAGGLSTPTFSGGVVTSYNYNFNGEQTSSGNMATNFLHAYDGQANTFTLNEATLIVEGHSADKNFGYYVQFDAGHDADVNNAGSGGDGTSSFDIQEAYITMKLPGTQAGLVVGKFATFEGIEVVESWSNPTITRGFLFTLMEPVNHVGAYATYQISPEFDVALGVVNGWNSNQDNNDGKTIIFKAHYNKGNDLDVSFNGTYGAEQAGDDADKTLSLDLVAMTKKVKNLDLWGELNYNKTDILAGTDSVSAFGLGLQAVYHIDDKWSLGGRFEYVKDSDGALTGGLLPATATSNTLMDISVSPKYSFSQSLYIRGEVRVDISKEQIYPDDTGPGQSKNQIEVALEAGYVFP